MRKANRPPSSELTATGPLDLQTSGKPTNMHREELVGDLLLRHPNFVAKSADATLETRSLACEAGALTTEPTARECT